MEDTSNTQTERKQKYTIGRMFGIFAAAIILICGLIFLFNYNDAYHHGADGGFIPPSFAVVFYYFLVVILCIFDADTCADWQNNSEKELISIPIQYVISD